MDRYSLTVVRKMENGNNVMYIKFRNPGSTYARLPEVTPIWGPPRCNAEDTPATAARTNHSRLLLGPDFLKRFSIVTTVTTATRIGGLGHDV